MFSSIVLSLLALGANQVASHPFEPREATQQDCKCLPGDECWPAVEEWTKLNETVGGRLIATVPLGSPCHGDSYNEAECKGLQDQWLYSTIQ